MTGESVRADDPKVRKGAWIYCTEAPSGWFLITARWRSAVVSGRDVHVALYGRGPRYLLDFRPDDPVRLLYGPPPGALDAAAAHKTTT